ncbi:hypothetical protein BCUN_2187 [Bifidobacterium cuniculi]|uniref:Uncharacterized protein n=1 Tax=Bifidobacterium cuniculi TaxID=1688 RepID=A0A087AJM7_9BIFI|nr:hypothetical protein [Bifidobacterium cuniculi]KFI58977.1 hypothetical protein BCUN_2187 [Bifidobacterium cuniculi]
MTHVVTVPSSRAGLVPDGIYLEHDDVAVAFVLADRRPAGARTGGARCPTRRTCPAPGTRCVRNASPARST